MWAQNKLGSPLEDERKANEPQGLSRSRKLLRPMGDVKVDAVLGARQGQLTASSSQLCPFYSVLSFCSACAAQAEQQVKDHQQIGCLQEGHWLLALCLTEPDPSSLTAPPLLTPLPGFSPFQMALYFCTGVLDDESLFHHYALNVPFYTHFTSPIRRYADIVVHRLLSASLGASAPLHGLGQGQGPWHGSGAGGSVGMLLSLVPFAGARSPITMEKEAIQKQADHCNDRKMASKRVQELSADLFFSVFVRVRPKALFSQGISGFPCEGPAYIARGLCLPTWL